MSRYENESSSCAVRRAYGLVRVQHGLGPCLALLTSTPDDLGPSKLVLPGLGALVTNAWSPKHLVKGELFHELSPSVGGHLESLDKLLSIALVV